MFALIVCSLQRSDSLERLFQSLQAQEFGAFEVILVDQNLDDRLVPLVAAYSPAFHIRHIRSPKGLSLARNRGLAEASGDYVAFPDDDCWYRPDTLATAAALFATHPELAVITGRTIDTDGLPSVSPTGETEAAITRDNYLHCGNSNGIFLRRSLLAEIGGFDERLGVCAATPFQSGEEADLLLRAIEKGKGLRFFPSLLVHHDSVDGVIAAPQIDRARKYGRGFGALLNKHRFGLVHTAYRAFRPLAGSFLALVRGDLTRARYRWAWLCGIVEGYWLWGRQDTRP